MANDKAEAKRRIREARAGGKLAAFDFAVRHAKGFIEAYLCSKCGTRIKALVEDDARGFTERVNGQVVNTRFLTWMDLPNYDEIVIEFDNGSSHITSICKSCARALDVGDLEAIYASDMEDMDSEDRHGVTNWERWAGRKPTGIKQVK